MKDGICPMCESSDVYMSQKEKSMGDGDVRALTFSAGEGRAIDAYYYLDTYVCVDCGYTAMFARSFDGSPGLSLLKNALRWTKVG
jgi:predicted DNA-binding helix-hairpin-helix protein